MKQEAKRPSVISRVWGGISWGAKAFLALILLGIVGSMVNPPKEPEPKPIGMGLATGQQTDATKLDDCINRGLAYYRSVGSFPKLIDGRNSVDAARERCGQSLASF